MPTCNLKNLTNRTSSTANLKRMTKPYDFLDKLKVSGAFHLNVNQVKERMSFKGKVAPKKSVSKWALILWLYTVIFEWCTFHILQYN